MTKWRGLHNVMTGQDEPALTNVTFLSVQTEASGLQESQRLDMFVSPPRARIRAICLAVRLAESQAEARAQTPFYFPRLRHLVYSASLN